VLGLGLQMLGLIVKISSPRYCCVAILLLLISLYYVYYNCCYCCNSWSNFISDFSVLFILWGTI